MDRSRNLLANLWCAVGLSGVVAHLTGFFPLGVVAQRYIIAPAPVVFSRVAGRETIAARFSVHIETESGQRYDFVNDGKGFAHEIDGPFLRRVAFVARGSYVTERMRKKSAEIFRYGLCGGPLVDELGIEGSVRRVEVRAWSALEREDVDQKMVVECRP